MEIKILFVDDEADIQALIELQLRRSFPHDKMTYLFASDGEEALEIIENDPSIELVLTDFKMPRMDGLTLLSKLHESHPLIVTVIMSAYGDMTNIRMAMNRGAFDFLVKPMNFEDMEATIQKAMDHIRKIKKNIKAREQAESALRASEDRYFQLIQALPQGIQENDTSGKITFASAALSKMLGYEESELIGKPIWDLEASERKKEARKAQMEHFRLNRPLPQAYQTKFCRKDGVLIDVQVDWEYRKNDEGELEGFTSLISDITEQKREAEEKQKLTIAIEQAVESIIITDEQGTIQYVNPAFEQTTGYTRQEAEGKTPRILKSGKHEQSFYREMWEALGKGEIWSGRIINRKKDGSFIEEFLTISQIRNRENEITNFVGVKRDISREVQLEKQLRQAQKMEAIGTLAGGIAHDFNNLLFAMLGYMTMAISDLPEESNCYDDLQEAIQAGRRAKSLVQQILTFSRQQESKLEAIEVVPVVKEALKLLRATIPTTIDIQQDFSTESLHIMGDSTQIHQVVVNLCANAAHAMHGTSGTLTITLGKVSITEEFARQQSIEPGIYAKFIVRDTGHGIEQHILDRIFDPFFTTKSVGEGTGMGLAVVHGIVQSHHGTITVSSEFGHGTRFEVYLPEISEEKLKNEKGPDQYIQGKGRILVIDDEPSLVKLQKRLLERCGYQVSQATSGHEGLKLFQEAAEPFDLVITDQTMPKMTGLQFAESIQKLGSKVPIILITGYKLPEEGGDLKHLGIIQQILKPVEAAQLSQIVDEALAPKL